jgi:hypothetical protein
VGTVGKRPWSPLKNIDTTSVSTTAAFIAVGRDGFPLYATRGGVGKTPLPIRLPVPAHQAGTQNRQLEKHPAVRCFPRIQDNSFEAVRYFAAPSFMATTSTIWRIFCRSQHLPWSIFARISELRRCNCHLSSNHLLETARQTIDFGSLAENSTGSLPRVALGGTCFSLSRKSLGELRSP